MGYSKKLKKFYANCVGKLACWSLTVCTFPMDRLHAFYDIQQDDN